MPDIFINTEKPVDRAIVAGINQPQREAPAGAFVAGSSYDINLYFVQNDGTYDAASGQAGQTVELAIAPVSEPESGTFTLTDGTDTTAAISFGASGQDVEDALNALNSDTGPNLGTASLVDVEKVSDTQYAITFRTLGAMTALSGNTVSLYPESSVTGSIAVTGSGSVYAQQVIEVTRQPAIYQPTWSTITNGFNATVALNTTRLLQAMVLERGEPFYLEVKLNGQTVAREVVTVEESNMPTSAFSGTAIASVLDAFAADPTSNASFDADAWNTALSIAAGNGDVVGPASAVDSNFAAFDGTTGKLIKDALVSASSFATAAQGTTADSALQPSDIDTLAELNAIVGDATLIDTTDSRLSDARTPTAHTHTAADIDAEASADGYVLTSDGAGNAAWEASGDGHDPVTVTDSAEIDFTLVGQDITASIVTGSIDETKLDASTNASLDLADSASQPGHTHTASEVTDFDTEVSNNTDVAANTAARHDEVSIAASGGRDYVTISGNQQLTLHAVDLTADVSGDLPITEGGTGASDAATARTNLGAQEDISGATITSATVSGTDKVLIQDTDDSDNLKTVTAQSIADLGSGGGGGGLTQTTGTDADTAMAVGNLYVVDMTSWATADRVYSLPTTAAAGDQIGITIKGGNATHTLDIQTTAASNDTINGVDHDSTPWSKLFQTGETVIFECVTANTDWIVVTDGRCPCAARIHRDDTAGAQTLTTSTFTKIQFTEETFNRGMTTDISTNYRITVRRAGIYKVFGVWHMDGLIGTGNALLSSLYVDGSRYNTAWHKTMSGASDEHSIPVLDTLNLSADSYVELYGFQASGGNRDTWANALAPNYLIVEEIL